MGFMDELKRLARPYEDEDEYVEEAEEEVVDEQPRERRRERREETPSYAAATAERRNADNVVNINTTTQLQVVLVKPVEFEEASNIANHLRDKRTVVLNLEAANKEISRRMVDFLSGVAYALEGKIKKVAISTYIITPYNVDIIGDVLDELENSGVRF
jgi:cell division inhibitor SepF